MLGFGDLDLNIEDNEVKSLNVEVDFILPLGLEKAIFPWGIHIIKEYVDKTCQPVSTQLWDFRDDKYFDVVITKYSSLLMKLFLSLNTEQKSCFCGLSTSKHLFLGTVLCAGDEFLKFVENKKLLQPSHAKELRDLKMEVDRHIEERIRKKIKGEDDVVRIWALSVYDLTLFNSLHISQLIKKIDPKSSIILGGDYFDFVSAEKVMENNCFIDGVMVGYGEEIIRKILIEVRQGVSIHELKIEGFLNKAYFQIGENSCLLKKINVPPFYNDLPTKPAISFVQLEMPNNIHVLTQRGCSWGKCTFCTQLDKHCFFLINNEQLLTDISEAIKTSKSKDIKIRFDSEEVRLEFLIPFLKYIVNYKDSDVCFDIWLWLPVKSFKKELISELLKVDLKKVKLNFGMNFESLNPETLKNMCKGHTPIQAIEAAKIIIDTGYNLQTNYFKEFPLENRDSIIEEVSILEKIMHLLKTPETMIAVFPYSSNRRDDLYSDQDKYKIISKPFSGDNWLQSLFGIDLPFSFWSYKHKNRLSYNFDSLMAYICNRVNYYKCSLNSQGSIVESLSGEEIIDENQSDSSTYRNKLRVWTAIFKLFCRFKRGRVYKKREDIFSYLSESTGLIHDFRGKKHCKFFIKNKCLTKEYDIPGCQEKWSINLSSVELNIFRYLYLRRRSKDVIEKFKGDMSEQEITKLIDHQIKHGSIVRYKDLLLSTVNDTEYWCKHEF